MPPSTRVPGDAALPAEAPGDAALLARLAARDAAAFGLLYDRHAGRVFGHALRTLGDAGVAESAVEAAFLALWRRAPRLDPRRTEVRTWLLTMVHRRGASGTAAGGEAPA